MPAVLVRSHAPFCWGVDSAGAAHNSVILEAVAKMAYFTASLMDEVKPISHALHDKHFLRKHGSKAYYGQTVTKP